MSRIEKALEKAAQLRQAGRDSGAATVVSNREFLSSTPVFEVGNSIINPAMVNKHIVCITDPTSSAAEQYKKLRARIFKTTEKDFLNSLLITSALEGEGKTVTAINLALTMAQEIDHTVLLIDADLRKPMVHTYLGLTPQYGLSDYLQGKVKLSDILLKTGIGKLVLLPAGNPPVNPSELLASEKMKDLVREMKYRYRDRYIIFDSSPLLTTAECLYLKEYIDGAIFVVQAGKTAEKSAAQAFTLLKGTHVFGTVFNNVPEYLTAHGMTHYNRLSAAGKKETLDAARVMSIAEQTIQRFISLFTRERLQSAGRTIKTSMNGLVKWTIKK
jgi:protein-tyrosine kinase